MSAVRSCLVLLVASAKLGADARSHVAVAANPIRKVVTLLEAMQKKITEEGEKEADLMKKFECYCSTNGGTLSQSIADAEAKAPAISSEITEKESLKAQTDEELKSHISDRSAAKAAIADATSIREKEAAAFAKDKALSDSNIEALAKAVAAISRGMTGGFLQTHSAKILQQLVATRDISEGDRQDLVAFLNSGGGSDSRYIPQSGEITGILEQIKEDMEKSLSETSAAESAAIASYEELKAAKTKEIEALTQSIETKSQRTGDLAVEIVTAKNDLTDTQQALLEDKKFLADLKENCGSKKSEWDERSSTRAEEILAISEAIKILNDDDALDLFKKTLPSASSSSLVQVENSAAALRLRAEMVLRRALRRLPNRNVGRLNLDFIALALQGKKVGFEKVQKMIDTMVQTLKAEQVEDDNKKEYCAIQFDTTDDKKKALERSLSDQETAIEAAEGSIATMTEDIKALTAGIEALDTSVAEASAQRKAEHSEYMELMSSNGAAKDVIDMAITRLNKFYNPKLVPAMLQLSALHRSKVIARRSVEAPPPAPETFDAYKTKTGENAGVISMLKTLIKELDKEMTEAETSEEKAQKDYEELMSDASEKKASDLKAMNTKKSALADVEIELSSHKDDKASTGKELSATAEYLQTLHSECDWLQQYYDVRKDARASEMDSLKSAKAVLSGSDFSLLQRPASFLQRSRAHR